MTLQSKGSKVRGKMDKSSYCPGASTSKASTSLPEHQSYGEVKTFLASYLTSPIDGDLKRILDSMKLWNRRHALRVFIEAKGRADVIRYIVGNYPDILNHDMTGEGEFPRGYAITHSDKETVAALNPGLY